MAVYYYYCTRAAPVVFRGIIVVSASTQTNLYSYLNTGKSIYFSVNLNRLYYMVYFNILKIPDSS